MKIQIKQLVSIAFVAVIAATTNVVGGFMITDRMLRMFKAKKLPPAAGSAKGGH